MRHESDEGEADSICNHHSTDDDSPNDNSVHPLRSLIPVLNGSDISIMSPTQIPSEAARSKPSLKGKPARTTAKMPAVSAAAQAGRSDSVGMINAIKVRERAKSRDQFVGM